MMSEKLNQVLIVKIPTRESYISPSLAEQYLESSIKTAKKKLGLSVYNNIYILNILISSSLTKSCNKLVEQGKNNNMIMIFNPKRIPEKQIISTIFKALATKLRSWSNKYKKGCITSKTKYIETPRGTIRKTYIIQPYGEYKEKGDDLERAADILEVLSISNLHRNKKVRRKNE